MNKRLLSKWCSFFVKHYEEYNGKNKTVLTKMICAHFDIELSNLESYHTKIKTKLEPSTFGYLEEIKKYIASEKCRVVGFDLFDTLIERPFWEPTDLFQLLNDDFNSAINAGTVIDFGLIRVNGEAACRKYYSSIRPSNEDVTLDEIYDYIAENYGFDVKLMEKIKGREVELEEKYCKKRKIGWYLYNYARYYNRKIVVVSDMYLPKTVLINILNSNGYSMIENFYLSNEIGVSKYSGNLYKYLLAEIEVQPNNICFIGDNYEVDYLNSKKCIQTHQMKARNST